MISFRDRCNIFYKERKMNFHGILFVRDEEDILDQAISHFKNWCKYIYVYDTGSLDDTWSIIKNHSSGSEGVIAVKKKNVIFEDWIRGVVFNEYRHKSSEGDWWIRLDADEFYHIPPPEFVHRYVDRHESLIFKQTYEFRLTDSEVEAWEQGKETTNDRGRPIEERRRHYELLEYPEPRLFQYRSGMKWTEAGTFPFNAGYPAQKRIPIRHYPHRDPQQLKKRVALRSAAANRPDLPTDFPHWKIDEWNDFVINENDDDLRYWKTGSDLPTFNWTNHMPGGIRRLIKRALYMGPVHILDRFRSGFDESYSPTPFPEEAQQEVRRAYERIDEEEGI
jgi:hypothetical protein